MGGADSEPVPFQTELDSFPETDQPSISRSNSGTNVLDGLVPLANGKTRGTKRDKGKAKEIDVSIIRVKEEPKVISLHSPEPVPCMVVSIPVFLPQGNNPNGLFSAQQSRPLLCMSLSGISCVL